MTMNEIHLDDALLTQYVNGELDETAVASLLAHMADCTTCLDQADQAWAARLAGEPVPPLDNATASRLERAVFKRIHAGNFSGEIVRISTRGFFAVFQALLRPFMRMDTHHD